MLQIYNKNKKIFIICAVVLALVLFILYLYALFLPGVWHKDTFLYQQKDGSFAGKDVYADYKLAIEKTDDGADISFSVNDIVKNYDILYDSSDLKQNIEILEDGNKVFKGRALGEKNDFILIDDETGHSDMISIKVGNDEPKEEELFPGFSKLYNWATSGANETRGNLWMFLLIIFLAAILLVDIKFPNLFWILEHRFEVDGGEPSEWYRFKQKAGYVILIIAITICTFLTFIIH